MGDRKTGHLRVGFDRRIKLEFHGAKVTSDAGLPAYRELDERLVLTSMADKCLKDTRTPANVRHMIVALLRQSVYGRLAGYEDVNDAARRLHAARRECAQRAQLAEAAQAHCSAMRPRSNGRGRNPAAALRRALEANCQARAFGRVPSPLWDRRLLLACVTGRFL